MKSVKAFLRYRAHKSKCAAAVRHDVCETNISPTFIWGYNDKLKHIILFMNSMRIMIMFLNVTCKILQVIYSLVKNFLGERETI